MFTRLRSSIAVFAALIAVACAPDRAIAGGFVEEQREACVATAEVVLVVLSLQDKAEQDDFVTWFYSRPPEVQAYLIPYFKLAMLAVGAGRTAQGAADEVFAVCMERRA